MDTALKIVIITPVRDEARTIGVTLECMRRQTLPPRRWIIVDDGSSDGTGSIVREHAARLPFLIYVRLADRGYRKPAQGVIEAFYEGYRRLAGEDYEVVAKFDGDLEFPADLLERISNAFRADPRLGITGGTRYERRTRRGGYQKVLVPHGFVGGPYKFYRRQCFEEIGGLVPRSGWDGVDIVRANAMGWRTGELADLAILHLKPTGRAEGEGLRRSCEKYGSAGWYMGGYAWHFLLRSFLRSMEMRDPRIGYFMLRGFWRARRNGEPRESPEFRASLRRIQRQNLRFWLRLALGGNRG
jgi:glycosyltransferase involved in cell wall biosynthesis